MFAGWVGRDHRLDAPLCQPIPQAVGVIGSVGQETPRRWNGWQQIACGRQVVTVAGGDQEGDRPATILGQRVDFGCTAAARAANRLFEVPPFAPAAERWALMWVESIDIVPIRPVEPVSA
jgi:hypothetical protein